MEPDCSVGRRHSSERGHGIGSTKVSGATGHLMRLTSLGESTILAKISDIHFESD